MITIDFKSDDPVGMRFAYSPLVELVMSFMVYSMGTAKHGRFHHHFWFDEATEALAGVQLPYMNALLSPVASSDVCKFKYVADFLTPTPTTAIQKIEDEFQRVLATPRDVIRKNVQYIMERGVGINEIHHEYIEDPDSALLCLIEELRLYWNRTLSHHWPNMRSILENDVLYRARQMALEGTDALFANLNRFITLNERRIIIDKDKSMELADSPDYDIHGCGIRLVPAVFTMPSIVWQITPEFEPMLIYGARGTGLWNQPEPVEEDAYDPSLEITVGAGKARILQALVDPANTGELARKLHVTAGAVSQHLGKLSEAGLVEAHRSGNRVFYRLSPRGEQLLEVFT